METCNGQPRIPAAKRRIGNGRSAIRLLIIFATALVMPAIAGAQLNSAPPARQSAESSEGTATPILPIYFTADPFNRMTVPVRLATAGPYAFMVDTGSNRTVVSRQLATLLRLPLGDRVQIHSATGEATVFMTNVKHLQFGSVSISAIDTPMLDRNNIGADGILGTDTLQSTRVVFDFGSGTMSIVRSGKTDLHEEPGSIVVEARRRAGRLIVTDATAAGRHITVVLDTGAQVSIGNEALRNALFRQGVLGLTEGASLQSVTGDTIQGDYIFLSKLEIDGITLTNFAVVFAAAHTFKELRLDRKPAMLLGMNAFRAFKKVSLDFGTSQFAVIAP